MTDIEYYDDATYYGVGFTEGDMTNCKDGDLWAKPIMQENGCEVGILHVMKDGEWVPVESENERKHKDEIAAAYALGVEPQTFGRDQRALLRDIARLIRAPIDEAAARIAQLLDEHKKLERELADAKRKLAMGGGAGKDAASDVREIGGVKVMLRAVEGVDAKDLKSLVDEAKKSLGSGVVAIACAAADGKAGIVVGVTDDLTGKLSAVDFVRIAAEKLGGKGGGGRPDLAQGGGPDSAAIDAALAAIGEALANKAA